MNMGAGFATRSPQARRPNSACGSTRRPRNRRPAASGYDGGATALPVDAARRGGKAPPARPATALLLLLPRTVTGPSCCGQTGRDCPACKSRNTCVATTAITALPLHEKTDDASRRALRALPTTDAAARATTLQGQRAEQRPAAHGALGTYRCDGSERSDATSRSRRASSQARRLRRTPDSRRQARCSRKRRCEYLPVERDDAQSGICGIGACPGRSRLREV